MPKLDIRKEMPGVELPREQFSQRMQQQFSDPAFHGIRGDVDRIIEAAWQGYRNYGRLRTPNPQVPAMLILVTSYRSNGRRPAAG